MIEVPRCTAKNATTVPSLSNFTFDVSNSVSVSEVSNYIEVIGYPSSTLSPYLICYMCSINYYLY